MSQAPAHQFEWWDHIFILHALKVGLAGVLALFFAETLRLQFPQWSLFTVMVLMIVQYPGSIALKSLFRFVGTLIGASLGVWVVSDYASAPIAFLSLTFLVMSFASYKAGQLGRSMVPYGYLLAGLTLITIESSGLTQPDKAWSVALSRTEEIFVGIIVVLIITPLFGLRRPRLEFQQLARSMVDQLTNLTNAKLQDIRERKSSSAALMEQQTALLRKLLSLDSLLTAERRESLYFSANTSILHKIRDSLQRLVQAVFDLNQPSVDGNALNERFRTQFETIQNLFQHSCSTGCRALIADPSVFVSGFQSLDAEIDRWLRTDDIKVLPADELAALLRCSNTLCRIQNELLNLHSLEIQLQRGRQDTRPQSEPQINQRRIDRRLVIVGIKGGLASVISLFLVVWLHLPGASIIPTAAWTAVLLTSYEIAFGRPGHLRSFQNLLRTALIGFLIVLVTLVLAPFMSNYWFMNLILFCILFGYGYFASKTPGMTFWMLGTLLLVSVLVAFNAQKPVPFATIMDSYLGVMIGLTLGVTIARVFWPTLPQNELRTTIARFCNIAKSVLDENSEGDSEGSMSEANCALATLPFNIAQTTAAIGINRFLRQEQAKWNQMVPILVSLSAQLPRLTSIRAKVVDSREMRLYLDSCHQHFFSWMEAFGHFFCRPDSKKILPALEDQIHHLRQEMERLKKFLNEHSLQTLKDLNEYLVAAELMRRCGDIALSLRLSEYWGDYFL